MQGTVSISVTLPCAPSPAWPAHHTPVTLHQQHLRQSGTRVTVTDLLLLPQVHSYACARSVGLDEGVLMWSHRSVSLSALSLPHSPHALSRPPSSSRLSGLDSYRNLPFRIGFTLLVMCILGSPVSLHGFDSSFLFSEEQYFFFFFFLRVYPGSNPLATSSF